MPNEPVAALYRVSDQKQVKKEDDLETQIAIVRNYATNHNMSIIKDYKEEGVSAYHNEVSDRVKLREILVDAAAGLFKTLLVFKADRLSRQSFGYPLYLHELSKNGVRVISVSENKELAIEDHTDKLIRFLEGWQAEGESYNKSVHVSAHMRERAKTGKYLGGRPAYGFCYDKQTKEFSICEPEAEILRYAFSRIFDVGSIVICKELNLKGLRTRHGTPWAGSVLRRIMRNPIVAGLRAYGKTVPTGKGLNRVRAAKGPLDFDNVVIPRDEDGKPMPDPNLAIIPFDTWIAAMQTMHERTPDSFGSSCGRSLNEGLMLTGFARCAECGAPLVASRYRKKLKNKTTVVENYMCKNRYESGKSICKGQRTYSAQKIDKLFLQELEKFLTKIDIEELSEHFKTQLKVVKKEAKCKQNEYEKRLKKSKKLYHEWLERLDQYLLNPDASFYSEELLARKVKDYEIQVKECESQLDKLCQDMAIRTWENEQMRLFSRFAPRWFEIFYNASLAVKKQMLRTVIAKVEVGKDSIFIDSKLNLIKFIETATQEPCEEMKEIVIPFSLIASMK